MADAMPLSLTDAMALGIGCVTGNASACAIGEPMFHGVIMCAPPPGLTLKNLGGVHPLDVKAFSTAS